MGVGERMSMAGPAGGRKSNILAPRGTGAFGAILGPDRDRDTAAALAAQTLTLPARSRGQSAAAAGPPAPRFADAPLAMAFIRFIGPALPIKC